MNTRTSKLIFPAILFLFACLIAFGENGPTPQIIVGSSGISDGSITNAKLAEPVSVANGGTGKTTAAEALAALGGASLNGSSTVDFACATNTFSVLSSPFPTPASNGYFKTGKIVSAIAVNGTATMTGFVCYATTSYVTNLSTAKSAIFNNCIATSSLAFQSASGNFTTIKDNAGTVNCYIENNLFTVQNKTASPQSIGVFMMGTTDKP